MSTRRKPAQRRSALAPASPAVTALGAATSATKPAPPPSKKTLAANSYQQPSTRSYRTWTPAQLRSVAIQADGGNMSALADLCDQLLADERIRKSYETVVGGLLSLPLDFEVGVGRRKKRAKNALDIEEDWWAAFPEAELQQFLTAGRIAGVAFAQLRWEFRKDRLVPKLEPWSLANFRFDWQQRKWFARVGDGVAEVEVTPGDGRWVMYAPYGTTRPWSLGQWRGLAPWWLLKRYAVSDWGRTGAVGASFVATPIPDQVNDESIKDQRRQLSDHIYELSQQGGVIVLPNGFKLEVVETTANTSRIYKEQIATANTSIDIAVQGQNLTSQVEGGSFAATSVHSQVQDRVIANVASSASTTLHDQALTKWAEFNFGSAELAPWPVWDTEPPEDALASAEASKAEAEAVKAWQDAGYDIENVEEIAAERGIKLVKREAVATPETTPASEPVDPSAPPAEGEPVDPTKPKTARKAAVVAAVAGGAKIQDTALNGAQVTAMQGMLEAVAAGSLPLESVRATIVMAYNASDDEVARIMDPLDGFEPKTPAPPTTPKPTGNNGDSNARRSGASPSMGGGARPTMNASGTGEEPAAVRLPIGPNGESISRLIICGGPRTGKSTLARSLRASGVPTFCGDPQSKVKEPEDGVTYLPEGIPIAGNDGAAQWILDNWLSKPGPWVLEGWVLARVLRRWLAANSEGAPCDAVLVLQQPRVDLIRGQATMLKGVATVWAEIAPQLAARGIQILDAPTMLGTLAVVSEDDADTEDHQSSSAPSASDVSTGAAAMHAAQPIEINVNVSAPNQPRTRQRITRGQDGSLTVEPIADE